jgi:hypothetical protein
VRQKQAKDAAAKAERRRQDYEEDASLGAFAHLQKNANPYADPSAGPPLGWCEHLEPSDTHPKPVRRSEW